MSTLKQNVDAFNSDVRENSGYRYTTHARYSSVVANRRQTEVTLKYLRPGIQRVLDAGCGDGTYTAEIKAARPSLEIVGFDPASEAIELARKSFPNVAFAVGDILHPETVPSGKFDLIIFRGVLHHLSDAPAAIRVCAGLAGAVLIIEPNGNNMILKVIERLSPYHREHEEQSFSSWKLARWCREAGFKIQSVEFIGFVPFFSPDWMAKLIYFFQPVLERVPLLCRFFGAQTVILCTNQAAASHAMTEPIETHLPM